MGLQIIELVSQETKVKALVGPELPFSCFGLCFSQRWSKKREIGLGVCEGGEKGLHHCWLWSLYPATEMLLVLPSVDTCRVTLSVSCQAPSSSWTPQQTPSTPSWARGWGAAVSTAGWLSRCTGICSLLGGTSPSCCPTMRLEERSSWYPLQESMGKSLPVFKTDDIKGHLAFGCKFPESVTST